MTDNVVNHPAIEPEELYDGPQPGGRPFVQQTRPQPQQTLGQTQRQQVLQAQIIATVRAGLAALSARLLGFIATATACGVWSYAVINPDTPRTIAACGFSITVLAPVIIMYLRKG